MKNIRILRSAVIIPSAAMLAACGSIVAGDPKWEVPIISQNCKPIDGVYFTFEKEQRAFLNVLITDKSTKKDNRFTSEIYDKSNLVNPLNIHFINPQ
ncbi:hypothetical protein [Diaphorobacter aerolatus]|uniref:Uncharacterized protein n=1 Tax=Diaphorobacter aerolatus TaxID=1288495 RepID=A0A7H0GKF6_9BURK|nr:hypothetical protein [Diaphorobacter aerolatus]QNP48772.1 hypothetical protein H9K75_00545 [Diaphorobacter aerolatus]